MAHSLSFHLLLIAIGLIAFQSLLVHNPNVNAYKTYEISKYCRQLQPGKGQKASSPEDLDKLPHQREAPKYEDDEDGIDDDDDEGKFRVTKTIVVDGGRDESSIQIVLSSAESRSKQRNFQRCSLFVAAKKPNGLIVTIHKLNLRSGVDWLRLMINNGTFVREFSHVKINDERDSVAYVANHGVLIELLTGYSVLSTEDNEIELTLTNFREADLCKLGEEYDCGSFRCISDKYLCDGINNCGDGRDETGCPMDNITNYIIISCILLLVAMFIFVCMCYRCCCQSQKRRYQGRPYQYVKIRTSSLAASPPGIIKRRASSIPSDSEVGPLPNVGGAVGGIPGRHNSIATDNLRRFRLTHVADSTPILVPSSTNDYGTTGNTYMHLVPYPAYATIHLGSNSYGLVPAHQIFGQGRNRSRGAGSFSGYTSTLPSGSTRHLPSQTEASSSNESQTFPLPQPTYPMLHPQLFSPPSHTPPPPPYSPRSENQTSQPQQPDTNSQPTPNAPPEPPTSQANN